MDGEVVRAQHGGDLLPECAALVEVHLVLEVLEADSELGVAPTNTSTAETILWLLTTVAINITGVEITELLQPQLKHPLGPRLSGI